MPAAGRVHLVLVPGFAGFDALGQLEYYAGITPLLRGWQAASPEAPPVTLHYFDNLPTAGVATRARRLRSWLAKRAGRGELRPGDAVALVGHSTGGLDIRRLLLDLDEAAAGEALAFDGDREGAVALPPGELLGMIRRVVFLSVPQRGTNIADWVCRHEVLRKGLVVELQALVGAAGVAAVNALEERVAGWVARRAGADLFLALRDVVAEIDAEAARPDLEQVAAAQEAGAELGLWLRHVAADFGAIQDLCAEPPPGSQSPAHRGDLEREAERRLWARRGIATRSFATRATRPVALVEGQQVAPWELLHPSTSPWEGLAEGMAERTDAPYLCGWRACAGGPFAARVAGEPLLATPVGGAGPVALQPWDSDGIVNTGSMLWPDGPATRLLSADHADVIGHHRLAEERPGGLRRYHTYDLLRSGCGFGADGLRALWEEIFTFCAQGAAG